MTNAGLVSQEPLSVSVPMKNRWEDTRRIVEYVLASVFLVGALLKLHDINLFAAQIRAYGVISAPKWLASAALVTLAIETGLGAALALKLRLRGMTYLALTGLLCVFTALIAYGWAVNDLEDCGCFGPIEMSPGLSILKNIALLVLILFAWRKLPKAALTLGGKAAGAAKVIACVAAGVAISVTAYARLEPAAKPIQQAPERPFAQFIFDKDGVHYDLGTGEYLVAMLSMTCEHCAAAVPDINTLASTPGMPTLVAICHEEAPGQLDEFQAVNLPTFPLLPIGDRYLLFLEFIGDAPPRYHLVRDGISIAHWDEKLPTVEEIQAKRQEVQNAK